MKICWKNPNGKDGFCLTLPGGFGGVPPIHRPKSAVEARDAEAYPELLTDAMMIDFMHCAVKNVADKNVREALEGGIESSIQRLQERGKVVFSVTLQEDVARV